MSDKKHIDRLFQEKLKDFDATPDDAVWKSIEQKLHPKKRKRRVIPLWWRIGGVAAVLALLFTVGSLVFDKLPDVNTTNPIVNTDEADAPSGTTPNDSSVFSNNNEEKVVTDNSNEETFSAESIDNKILNESKNKGTTLANQDPKSNEKGNYQNPNEIIEKVIKQSENAVTNSSTQKGENNLTSPNQPELDQNNSEESKNSEKMKALVDPKETNESNVNTSVANVQPGEDISNLNDTNTKLDSPTIEEALAQTSNTDEEEKNEKLDRWHVSTTVAPVYFNSLGDGSSLDQQLVGNSKSGEINLSYGINGTYAINEKLKIRAGIHKVDLGYRTNDVIVYKSAGISKLSALSNTSSHIKFENQTDNTSLMSGQNLSSVIVPEIIAANASSSLNQEFGFIEVPVELEYALLNKKLGLNVISGFSTFFLDKNKVYSTLNGEKALLGEANNINNTSFSANFGLGLNYSVSDKVKFILEPTFKYQIRTFRDTSGDFNPYFIGIYTGLNYKF